MVGKGAPGSELSGRGWLSMRLQNDVISFYFNCQQGTAETGLE